MGRHTAVNRVRVELEGPRSYAVRHGMRRNTTARAAKVKVTAAVKQVKPWHAETVKYEPRWLNGRMQEVGVRHAIPMRQAKTRAVKVAKRLTGLSPGLPRRNVKTTFTGKKRRIW